MRMLQVCAVDFTAYHLLGPLMRASRDDGWQVEFACADGPFAAHLRDEGFVYRAIPMTRLASSGRQLRAALTLARSLRARSPDLIHTHTPAGGLAGRAAALTWKGPVVHTFHGLPFQGAPRSATEHAFLLAERVLARRTTWFFSQAQGDVKLAAALGITRPAETEVIGNGVDLSRFRPGRAEGMALRSSLGIPADAIVVLTVARLVREKGLLELADAALSLRSRSRLHFLLVGEPLPSDRTSVATELDLHAVANLGDRWRRLGHRTDVDRLLRASDLFVLPSYREGLPRSIIEAMATGLPVIATDIAACRELVRQGETGTLVPIQDAAALAQAIGNLADDEPTRAHMGERARTLAEHDHDERAVLRTQLATFRRLARR